jgi:hypothetical protein
LRARLANHNGRDFRIIRCPTRRTPRNDTIPTNGLVLELKRREGCRRFLLVNVIGEIAELVLNLPEMVVNTLIVTLSVAL